MLHADLDGELFRIDHWDDAAAQGAHVARTMLHDQGAGRDPGTYHAVTAYVVSVYGSSLMGAGITGSDAVAHTMPGGDDGLVTTFAGRGGTMTGAVGWQATREVHAIRQELALRRSHW